MPGPRQCSRAFRAVLRRASRQVRAIFAKHTPLIEPLSLDEAYLDVTENLQGIATATEIAELIRVEIKAETGLTASAGVSYNKFLAKLASDYRKPDGLYVITPKMGADFVESLPVGKFHGIGPATTARMNGHGIHTGADLRAQSLDFLQRHFGKAGAFYYWISRGVDERPVRADRVRKSVGAENTFNSDLFTLSEGRDALQPIIEKVWHHCESTGTRGRTVTLKVKHADFHQITRSLTCDAPIATNAALEQVSYALLEPVFPVQQGIRLLGVTLSSLGCDLPQNAGQLRLSL